MIRPSKSAYDRRTCASDRARLASCSSSETLSKSSVPPASSTAMSAVNLSPLRLPRRLPMPAPASPLTARASTSSIPPPAKACGVSPSPPPRASPTTHAHTRRPHANEPRGKVGQCLAQTHLALRRVGCFCCGHRRASIAVGGASHIARKGQRMPLKQAHYVLGHTPVEQQRLI